MYATKDYIHDAGVKLVVTMYGCDIIRTIIFKDRCNDRSWKEKITLDRFPPAVVVVGLYSERAYQQIQDWQGNSLDPQLFDWKMVDDLLEPIPMNNEPA